jgi:hypothetical protein
VQLQYAVSEAQSAAELRAAAYLRAHSFYSYPADRNAFVARVGRPRWAVSSAASMLGRRAPQHRRLPALPAASL